MGAGVGWEVWSGATDGFAVGVGVGFCVGISVGMDVGDCSMSVEGDVASMLDAAIGADVGVASRCAFSRSTAAKMLVRPTNVTSRSAVIIPRVICLARDFAR